MELAIIISVVSICGFAVALSYNVYEFRKVGRALDEGREEHRKMIQALDRINESLVALAKGLGARSRKTK